ncbi:MAG: adenylate kinase family protein [Candidatus Thermoplasmatota archaeon]
MVRIALTGTPGVGKTSLAKVAAEHGWRVVDVKAWARAEGCIAGHDAEDEADAIDVEALAERVPADDGSNVLYEGHLSHFLDLDEAWVVRCDPAVLRGRLVARGYRPAKVVENLEAEALDIILQEALDVVPRVIQRDGTRRRPEALFAAFADSPRAAAKGHDLEPVDWSSQLPF